MRNGNDDKSLIRKTKAAARSSSAAVNEAARDIETAVARFTSGDRSIDFNVDPTADTVWATQQQIADLFRVDQSVVSRHIRNIFNEGEVEEGSATHARIASVHREGSRDVTRLISHYSLDVILSVGYRVDSRAATNFRRWATSILRSYIERGFALNEQRLRDDPKAADDLAARIRAIRSEEKHRFAKVRDTFAIAASDYDASSRSCSAFFALLQDKLHVAASGLTACRLILTRADHREAHMGLTSFAGERPVISDTKIGKNYLSEQELRVLYIASEQFLLYMESKAVRNQTMTMRELIAKFDELLRVQGYEIFVGYKGADRLRKEADKHAAAEFGRYLVRQPRAQRVVTV